MGYNKKEIIENLEQHISDDEKILVSYWTGDDFQMTAEESFGVRLTDRELEMAMSRTQNNFDPTHGINWDVIEVAIESVIVETRPPELAEAAVDRLGLNESSKNVIYQYHAGI